jgi:DNA-3-methyladenine glycosylase
MTKKNVSGLKATIKNSIVPESFYYRGDNHEFSQALLGKYLIRLEPFLVGGKIVETESYPGKEDLPSHHSNGKLTDRTKVLFDKKKGLMYVYMIYGMYHCLSITSGNKKGDNNVTLIRALEPVFGIEKIKKKRKTENLENLLNGPGKLTQGLNITKDHYGQSLYNSDFVICDLDNSQNFAIETSSRIGIKNYGEKHYKKPWRFYIKDSKFISK